MSIIYKGFGVYAVDPVTLDKLAYLGNHLITFISTVSNIGNVSYSGSSAIGNMAGYLQGKVGSTEYRQIAGISVNPGGSAFNDAIDRLREVIPITNGIDLEGYGNCKIKLIAKNGSYLLSSGQLNASGGFTSNSWSAYDAEDNLIAAGMQLYIYDYATGTASISFISQNGLGAAIYPGSYKSCRLNSDNASTRLYTNTTTLSITDSLADFFNEIPQTAPDKPDPFDDLPIGGDEPLPGGGTIPEPGFPTISAASTGIIGLFVPTVAQMQQLSDFMWTDFGGTATDIKEVLEEILEALKRTISNPLDYIFGLNIIPSQGLTVGASKVVRFGYISSGVSMPVLTNHYFSVDCGSLSFDTVCDNSFLDYAPYSKFSIYLPYVGFKDVDPNDFVGHTISVKYHGDAITGGLTAYIFKDNSVMYQYSGGCALSVPLSADSWGETIAACMGIAAGIGAGEMTSGLVGAVTEGVKGVASNLSSLSPKVMHSGAVSGSPACMGVQYPFVIREAVNFHSTAGFNKSSGYPAYYYKKLLDVSGYTTVIDAHMTGITGATQGEIDEIERLLESGVIL